MLSGEKGTGYIPDLFNPADVDTHIVSGAKRGAVSDFVDDPPETCMAIEEAGAIQYIQNQGGSSACTGEASCQVIEQNAWMQGNPLPRLSPLLPYTGGRILGGDDPRDGLIDAGARPRDVVLFLQKCGAVREGRFPLTNANLRLGLPVHLAQEGYDARIESWYKILGYDLNELLLNLRRTIHSKRSVMWAQPVDARFNDYYGSGTINGPMGRITGYHMTSLHGYERDKTDPSGYRFRGRNSWGAVWGDHGLYWISGARVIRYGSDFYTMHTFNGRLA